MKNLKFLLTGIIIMVIISSCGAASAERKAIKKAQEQQVALNVEKLVKEKKIDIAEDFSKKGEYLLFFKTYSGKDLWEITVQIYDNGKVNIGCSSNSKDYISYMGDLQNIW